MAAQHTTYLIVDGENIDGVLGSSILGRKPEPSQRPRWQHLLDFAADHWDQPVKGLFFINATKMLPTSFVQALLAIGYQPIPLSGRPDEKVVDIGISRTLAALRDRPGDVLLGTHDADFVGDLTALAGGDRRIGVVGFTEFFSQQLREVPGIELLDLEDDARAFDYRLEQRVRVIPLDRFDPLRFL